MEKAVKNVKEMYNSVNMNKNRKEFFKDLNEIDDDEKFIKKHFPDTIKVKLERNIRKILVKTNLFKKVKKIAKKILRK